MPEPRRTDRTETPPVGLWAVVRALGDQNARMRALLARVAAGSNTPDPEPTRGDQDSAPWRFPAVQPTPVPGYGVGRAPDETEAAPPLFDQTPQFPTSVRPPVPRVLATGTELDSATLPPTLQQLGVRMAGAEPLPPTMPPIPPDPSMLTGVGPGAANSADWRTRARSALGLRDGADMPPFLPPSVMPIIEALKQIPAMQGDPRVRGPVGPPMGPGDAAMPSIAPNVPFGTKISDQEAAPTVVSAGAASPPVRSAAPASTDDTVPMMESRPVPPRPFQTPAARTAISALTPSPGPSAATGAPGPATTGITGDAGLTGLSTHIPPPMPTAPTAAQSSLIPAAVQKLIDEAMGSTDADKKDRALAIAQAGFAMMASQSPYPMVAIGQGGMTGLGAYQAARAEAARKRMLGANMALKAAALTEEQRRAAAESLRKGYEFGVTTDLDREKIKQTGALKEAQLAATAQQNKIINDIKMIELRINESGQGVRQKQLDLSRVDKAADHERKWLEGDGALKTPAEQEAHWRETQKMFDLPSVPPSPSSGGTRESPATPGNKAEYDALPSGTFYRNTDGTIRQKK